MHCLLRLDILLFYVQPYDAACCIHFHPPRPGGGGGGQGVGSSATQHMINAWAVVTEAI